MKHSPHHTFYNMENLSNSIFPENTLDMYFKFKKYSNILWNKQITPVLRIKKAGHIYY